MDQRGVPGGPTDGHQVSPSGRPRLGDSSPRQAAHADGGPGHSADHGRPGGLVPGAECDGATDAARDEQDDTAAAEPGPARPGLSERPAALAAPGAAKSPHTRCRASRKRLAVATGGRVELLDPTVSPTRAAIDAMGRIWVDPTQVELDEAIAAGAVEELVFARRLSRPVALRLAAEVFAGTRSTASLGARLVPLVTALTEHPRDVADALEQRRERLEHPERLELPDPTNTAQLAAFLATYAPDEVAATQLVALAPRLARILRDHDALAVGLLDACDPYRAAASQGWRLDDRGVAARLVCEFLLAIASRGVSPTALTKVLVLATVPLAPGSGDLRFTLLDALGSTDVALGTLPGGLECLTLALAGALGHPAASQLGRPRLRTLAGMIARGWELEAALARLEGLAASELAGWEVLDDPPTSRRELARAAEALGADARVRFLAARSGITWATARGVLDEIDRLGTHEITPPPASLRPAALGVCESWLAPHLGEQACGAAALRLAALFGDSTARYHELATARGLSAVAATRWLPETGVLDRVAAEQLGSYIVCHLAAGADEADLEVAARHWSVLDAEQRCLKPSALRRHLLGLRYRIVSATPLGHASARLDLEPEAVASAAGCFALGASQLRWLPTGLRHSAGLGVEFLDRASGEGILLGHTTASSQRPGASGEARARHGQSAASGGFLVVRDRTGEIVAQSWVWLDETGRGVCLDGVEIAPSGDPTLPTRVRSAVALAARWLLEDGHGQVSVGDSHGRLPLGGLGVDLDPLDGPAGIAATSQRRLATGPARLGLRPNATGLTASFDDAYEIDLEPSTNLLERATRVTSTRELPAAGSAGIDAARASAARWLVSREVPVVVDDAPLAAALPTWARRPPLGLEGTLGGLAPVLELEVDREAAERAVCRAVADSLARAPEDDPAGIPVETAGDEGPPLRPGGEVLAWSSTRRAPVPEKLFGPEEPLALRALEGRLRDLDADAPWDDADVLADPVAAASPASYEEATSALFGSATSLHADGVPLKLAYLLGTRGWSEDQVAALWQSARDEDWRLPAALLATHRVDPDELARLAGASLDLLATVELAIDAQGT